MMSSTFTVTGPDNVKHKVTVPEGKTEQDAIQYIAETKYGISVPAEGIGRPEESGFQDFAEGVGLSGLSRSRRLIATVTISVPEASSAARQVSGLSYFPVPRISRELNSLPAMISLSFISFLLGSLIDLPPAIASLPRASVR